MFYLDNNLSELKSALAIFVAIPIVFSILTVGQPAQNLAAASATCENLDISNIKARGDDGAGNVAENAIDDNLGTRWSNMGARTWIRVDLGEEKEICSITIAWYKGDYRLYNFAVSFSSDNVVYTEIYSGKSSGTTLSSETYDLADGKARYVKINVQGNSENAWASITEIDVYGSAEGTSTLPAPDPLYDPETFIDSVQDSLGNTIQNGDTIAESTIMIHYHGTDNKGVAYFEGALDGASWTKITTPSLLAVSVAAEGQHSYEIRAVDFSGRVDQTPAKFTWIYEKPANEKILLALFLQYADANTQVDLYKPNMDSNDMTRLRARDGGELKSDYVEAAKSLPGSHGVAFTSSSAIVNNAAKVKSLGFDFIEFNLESGLSPSEDNADPVAAMKKAAEAAHVQGLKFRATPSKSYTTNYGTQIAPFVDYYHIQAQPLQDYPVDYSAYVHDMAPKLKSKNPKLIVTVQVSTQQEAGDGLTLLGTMKQCVASVMDVADGASVWFGNDDTDTLKAFVEWFDANYA